MIITRHKTDAWIKNNSVDVSVKDIHGDVTIHWHEFYEIELILDGSGIYSIDGIDYPIERGCLYFMSPSSFHRIHFTQNTKLINFMFSPDACDPYFLIGLFDASPHVFLRLSEENFHLIQMLAEEMLHTASIKYLSAMSDCILGKLQSLCMDTLHSGEHSEMQYALLWIQNHFREGINLESAAKIANYSPNYFGNKFKEYTGVTFKTYLLNLQFSLVVKMLQYTNLAVTEICWLCGFHDYANFTSQFKKRYGMTPKTYRQNGLPTKVTADCPEASSVLPTDNSLRK